MGQGESKPHFPTEQQWNNWVEDRNDKITKEITDLKKQRDTEMLKDIARTMELFDVYMANCHDKSKISRFFTDNHRCTDARSALAQHIAKRSVAYAGDIDIANKISNLK